MKKIILLLLIITILSTLNITAFATDKTEIEFSVGDETLLINKTPVTVVKPYVVGKGVTLVPVRVITEAFGAKVGWVEETSTVTLEYEDTNIVLQIGNASATVNGNEEILLSAPELTNSSTMVPLRFISEKFGAVVSYDEKTERITVLKEINTETMKKYTNENIGISFDIPRVMTESHSTENILRFYNDGKYSEECMIEIGVYTMEIWDDAEKMINKHRTRMEKYINPTCIKSLEKINKKQYGNKSSYEYNYELYYTGEIVKGKVTVFTEDKIAVVIDSRGISDEIITGIYESIDIKNIKSVNVANYKFNKENTTFLYDKPLTDIKITLPKTYVKTENTEYDRFDFEEYAEYIRFPGNVIIRCITITKKSWVKHYDAKDFIGSNLIKIDFKNKLESVGEYHNVMLGDEAYVEIDYVKKEDGKRIYCEDYIKAKDGIEYRFVVDYPELYYSDEVKQEIYNALGRI